MAFVRNRIVNLNEKEFNLKLKFVKKYCKVWYNKPVSHPVAMNAFIEEGVSKIKLTFLDPFNKRRVTTYVFDKSCSALQHQTTGLNAWTTLQRYAKIPHVATKEEAAEYFPAVSGILYYNPEHNGTRQHAVGYDMNSAFSWGMLQDMPKDTEKGPINFNKKTGEYNERRVGPDEIGFGPNGELRETNGLARYIFKKEKSPFNRFVDVWYARKKNAKNPIEKTKAKDMLVMCIGFMQRHNFWIRTAIIGYCNKLITHLIRKYRSEILLSNTDSIISTCRIPELDRNIGKNIGQWKLEHEGEFAYKNLNYQWDLNKPTYRGTSKSWFKDGWDILKDARPTDGNFFDFDFKNMKLVRA